MTTKELRQLFDDLPQDQRPRGILSKLKRKQDFVSFLQETVSHGSSTTRREQKESNGDGRPHRRQQQQKKKPKAASAGAPLNMPCVMSGTEKKSSQSPSPSPSPKDSIFERVYKRYPGVSTVNSNSLMEDEQPSTQHDVRMLYHPMLRQHVVANNDNDNKHDATRLSTSSDMDVIFLGTASCTPGTTRGVSCTALRLNWRRNRHLTTMEPPPSSSTHSLGGTWLFDVGECTQLQVQRSVAVRPSKITRIFLTHAHGDHTFGLPGLLCLMGQDRDRNNEDGTEAAPVEIYGPEGLRTWLRVAIRYSCSRIVPPYRVHEIMHVPMAPEWEFHPRVRRFFYKGLPRQRGSAVNGAKPQWGTKGLAGEDATSWISQARNMNLEPSQFYGEVEGGRDIYPIYNHPLSADGAPVWEISDEPDVRVYAAPMSHGIPCVGYVVEEQPRPGRLRNEFVEPIVRRNLHALKEAGYNVPMKAMAVIKNMRPDSAFTFPDGTVVTQQEAVEPPRQGRKVVLCGDTADCRALKTLAQDADLVIHEATNSYLPGVDSKDTTWKAVERDAIVHGHSTPQIAGDFAKKVNAKRLILNHFSSRYKGDPSVDSLSIMMRIEDQARKASGLNVTQVAAAWDLMVVPIPQRGDS